MQPPNLERSNASKGIRGMPPAHQQQKQLLLLLKRRKVAVLCGHHLDRLRILAMASVVRLSGGLIDRILEALMVCQGFG